MTRLETYQKFQEAEKLKNLSMIRFLKLQIKILKSKHMTCDSNDEPVWANQASWRRYNQLQYLLQHHQNKIS